jgi:hypothetical protein
MTLVFAPPKLPTLVLDRDDLEEQFRHFKYMFTSNMVAMKIKTDDKVTRAAYFRGEIPSEAQKILADYDFTKNEKDADSIEDMIEVIVAAKKKTTSQLMATHRFFGRVMKEGEKLDEYLRDIRSLAERCGFGTLKDRFLRDRLIAGFYDKTLQYELLRLEDKTTFDQVVQLCKKHEDSKMAADELHPKRHEANAVRVKFENKTDGGKKVAGNGPPPGGPPPGAGAYRPMKPCKFCGLEHRWGAKNCPAYGKQCKKCGGNNHAARVCRKKTPEKNKAHAIDDEDDQYLSDEQGDAVGEGSSSSDDEILRGSSPPKKMKSVAVRPDLRERILKRQKEEKAHKIKMAAEKKQDKLQNNSEPKPGPSKPRAQSPEKKKENLQDNFEPQPGPSRPREPTPEYLKGLDELDFEPGDLAEYEKLIFDDVNAVSPIFPKTWYENVAIDGRLLKMKIDSGCTTNVISKRDVEKLGISNKKIRPTMVKLVTYSKNTMIPVGEFVALVALRRKKIQAKFIVINEPRTPLLGCPTGTELGLFRIETSSILKFPAWDTMGEADQCTKVLPPCSKKVTIKLSEEAKPISIPARRVPLAIKDQVFQELKRMEEMGVIRPVTEPRPWCHAMVVGHKPNGKLRVCIDPRTINPHIAREEHMLPDIDNLIMSLEDAKVMSVIDLEAGFWQVEVDDESAKLLTFATPWGRYEYRRLPFGISIAPEIFHRAVVDALAGIPGVEVFIDDIFIHGKTDEEHDERFDLVLQRLVDNQFTPNLAKIQKKKRKVKFLGHVIGEGQVEPDPDKIRALLEAPEPTSRKDLKSFIGALAWNRKYIPNVHDLCAPFRDLMKERTPWRWEESHAEAFTAIKTKMREVLPLMSIRNGEPMILGTDASSYGLGACLTQKDEQGDERPIFFASRLMTDAELKWAQVDKELLAIVWGFERLDNYVYGRKITVRSDHKPLLGLVKKPLAHLSTRQQRLMARLMRYQFEIEFCPGKDLIVPDFLSRAVTNEDKACRCQFLGTDMEVEETFVSMVKAVQISEELEKVVRESSKTDDAYGQAIRAYMNAWPEAMKSDCGEYWSNREDLVAEEDLLFFQGRLVVPRAARPRILASLHRGHVGCKAAMKRADKTVWWPGWTVSIKEYRNACGQCQVMRPAQQKEPMLSFKVPPAPGLVWHSDYLTWRNHEYVFFTDGFSGWTELYTAPTRCPGALIRITRLQIMRQGIPRKIHADQGTAYHSREFQEFCDRHGIQLVLSSPKHEQGNAVAEATVKKIKHLFKGAQDEDELMYATVAMNQTPLTSGRLSPAEIHFGRNLRDELHDVVKQVEVNWAEVQSWKKEAQLKSKCWYDKGARELGELTQGEKVHVWHNEKWQKAQVKKKVEERPRSYLLELENGRTLERNRVKIRKNTGELRQKNEKTVSPSLTFQQAWPAVTTARRGPWVAVASAPTTNDESRPPPDQENGTSSANSRPDIGVSRYPSSTNTMILAVNNSRPPNPPSPPPPPEPNEPTPPPDSTPPPQEDVPTTSFGRPRIAPDRWGYSKF